MQIQFIATIFLPSKTGQITKRKIAKYVIRKKTLTKNADIAEFFKIENQRKPPTPRQWDVRSGQESDIISYVGAPNSR